MQRLWSALIRFLCFVFSFSDDFFQRYLLLIITVELLKQCCCVVHYTTALHLSPLILKQLDYSCILLCGDAEGQADFKPQTPTLTSKEFFCASLSQVRQLYCLFIFISPSSHPSLCGLLWRSQPPGAKSSRRTHLTDGFISALTNCSPRTVSSRSPAVSGCRLNCLLSISGWSEAKYRNHWVVCMCEASFSHSVCVCALMDKGGKW